MATEDAVFTREIEDQGGAEKVTVFQTDGNFLKLEQNTKLVEKLSTIGLTPDNFRAIVNRDFADAEEAYNEKLTNGDIVEHVNVRVGEIGGNKIEVSHAKRKDTSDTPPSFEFQLREKEPGYKIIVGLGGEAGLRLPKTVEPTGEIYSATEEGDEVILKKGTVAIIESPVPWTINSSENNFEYLYISSPPWRQQIDITAVNPQSKRTTTTGVEIL